MPIADVPDCTVVDDSNNLDKSASANKSGVKLAYGDDVTLPVKKADENNTHHAALTRK